MDSAFSSPYCLDRDRRYFQEGSEGQYLRTLWKEDLRTKQSTIHGYNILKEYHNYLTRKGKTIGIKKDGQASNRKRVKVKIQWPSTEEKTKKKTIIGEGRRELYLKLLLQPFFQQVLVIYIFYPM